MFLILVTYNEYKLVVNLIFCSIGQLFNHSSSTAIATWWMQLQYRDHYLIDTIARTETYLIGLSSISITNQSNYNNNILGPSDRLVQPLSCYFQTNPWFICHSCCLIKSYNIISPCLSRLIKLCEIYRANSLLTRYHL